MRGSPVFSKVHLRQTKLTKYRPGTDLPTQVFDKNTPLEAKVEQRPLPFMAGKQKIALNLRLQLGRQWLKKLAKAKADGIILGDYASDFLSEFAFEAPEPKADALVCAHPEVWQQFAAVSGRSMDGWLFYEKLTDKPENWFDDIPGIRPDKPALKQLGVDFAVWTIACTAAAAAQGKCRRPAPRIPFACSAPKTQAKKAPPTNTTRRAGRYTRRDKSQKTLPMRAAGTRPAREKRFHLSHTNHLGGMPNTRWWPSRQTNWGHQTRWIEANSAYRWVGIRQ